MNIIIMVLPVHGMWTVIGDIKFLGSHKKPTGNCDKNKNNDTIIANLL